jgi:two-component system sensor histidine kinase FlrB
MLPQTAPQTPPAAHVKAEELQQAFNLFNRVSAELTQAYAALQEKVDSLTEELAVANGKLRRDRKSVV